jgi:hypothetical protein
MAAQVSLVPGLGHGKGVPRHSSLLHWQPTDAQSELFGYAPHVVGVPVQRPPDVPPLDPPVVAPPTPPVPAGVVMPPLPPAPPVGWPPVARDVGGASAPPVPPSPPTGSVGAHSHAVNVPAALQVWAPCCPLGHAHSTLAPGMHLGAPPPPPQAPNHASGMNEATIPGTRPMVESSPRSGFSATRRPVDPARTELPPLVFAGMVGPLRLWHAVVHGCAKAARAPQGGPGRSANSAAWSRSRRTSGRP